MPSKILFITLTVYMWYTQADKYINITKQTLVVDAIAVQYIYICTVYITYHTRRMHTPHCLCVKHQARLSALHP